MYEYIFPIKTNRSDIGSIHSKTNETVRTWKTGSNNWNNQNPVLNSCNDTFVMVDMDRENQDRSMQNCLSYHHCSSSSTTSLSSKFFTDGGGRNETIIVGKNQFRNCDQLNNHHQHPLSSFPSPSPSPTSNTSSGSNYDISSHRNHLRQQQQQQQQQQQRRYQRISSISNNGNSWKRRIRTRSIANNIADATNSIKAHPSNHHHHYHRTNKLKSLNSFQKMGTMMNSDDWNSDVNRDNYDDHQAKKDDLEHLNYDHSNQYASIIRSAIIERDLLSNRRQYSGQIYQQPSLTSPSSLHSSQLSISDCSSSFFYLDPPSLSRRSTSSSLTSFQTTQTINRRSVRRPIAAPPPPPLPPRLIQRNSLQNIPIDQIEMETLEEKGKRQRKSSKIIVNGNNILDSSENEEPTNLTNPSPFGTCIKSDRFRSKNKSPAIELKITDLDERAQPERFAQIRSIRTNETQTNLIPKELSQPQQQQSSPSVVSSTSAAPAMTRNETKVMNSINDVVRLIRQTKTTLMMAVKVSRSRSLRIHR
ncbi:hypothetical protein SSS_07285 [Sarcoptes scabiei]|nr:hypothetical protein SSS_07285 [Sarcoptes scabiei]